MCVCVCVCVCVICVCYPPLPPLPPPLPPPPPPFTGIFQFQRVISPYKVIFTLYQNLLKSEILSNNYSFSVNVQEKKFLGNRSGKIFATNMTPKF